MRLSRWGKVFFSLLHYLFVFFVSSPSFDMLRRESIIHKVIFIKYWKLTRWPLFSWSHLRYGAILTTIIGGSSVDRSLFFYNLIGSIWAVSITNPLPGKAWVKPDIPASTSTTSISPQSQKQTPAKEINHPANNPTTSTCNTQSSPPFSTTNINSTSERKCLMLARRDPRLPWEDRNRGCRGFPKWTIPSWILMWTLLRRSRFWPLTDYSCTLTIKLLEYQKMTLEHTAFVFKYSVLL